MILFAHVIQDKSLALIYHTFQFGLKKKKKPISICLAYDTKSRPLYFV